MELVVVGQGDNQSDDQDNDNVGAADDVDNNHRNHEPKAEEPKPTGAKHLRRSPTLAQESLKAEMLMPLSAEEASDKSL
jgi:hypothetical protein